MSEVIVRRDFLGKLAAGSAALTAACAQGTAPSAAAAPGDALDTWFGGMKGTYKVIYDCAGASGAADGTFFAHNILKYSAAKLGTKTEDNSVVVCYRHFATPFGYTDAIWAKYPQIAQMLKVDDPKTKKPATRNWLLHDLIEDEEGANIPGVTARGVQFAVCGAATEFIAKLLAGKTGDAKAIETELGNALIPNAKMVAAGVVAVQRAQKAGFAYTYAG
jgi:intracellular sulfur oxidation DsrE/DsrF family protein